MDEPSGLRILGVSGTMRANARGMVALRYVLETAARHGAQTRLLDLREADLPMFRPGEPSSSPAVQSALEDVTWADAFVLSTPDYHGSMSGAMKNFLDYHWKELGGKLFGYLCTSHEKGLTAMDQMRTAVRQCYGWSLPYGVAIHGEEDVVEERIANSKLEHRLRMLSRDLVAYGTVLREQFKKDLADTSTESFAARYRSM